MGHGFCGLLVLVGHTMVGFGLWCGGLWRWVGLVWWKVAAVVSQWVFFFFFNLIFGMGIMWWWWLLLVVVVFMVVVVVINFRWGRWLLLVVVVFVVMVIDFRWGWGCGGWFFLAILSDLWVKREMIWSEIGGEEEREREWN